MRDLYALAPLLNTSQSPRKRIGILRNFRRRLRVYIIILGILLIFAVTIIHKIVISKLDRSKEIYNGSSNIYYAKGKPQRIAFETRTVRTVVAKYIGPQPWWANGNYNLSQDKLDENAYNPDPKAGRNGRPVYLAGISQDKINLSFSINKFNLIASDKISVDRKLPDARKLRCRLQNYTLDELPDTSVIIVYHNEAWSTLVRTVHSILNTSPPKLIAEVLLIDDGSKRAFLGESLDNYMYNLSESTGVPIKVIRSIDRIGLIRARLLGVENARGKTLTFMDAHCEATKGWLEPLMDIIKNDQQVAAVPIIDTINDHTFAYKRTFDLYIGAFNWGLNFRWYPISLDEVERSNGPPNAHRHAKSSDVTSTDLINPFRTPAMAGGIFSIDKQYFKSIGSYDPNMDIWGAENIELSLRIWQCGGQIKAVPCSHVAHLFRKSSPYNGRSKWNVDDIFNFNRVRLIEVWLDEWKDFVYSMNPILQDSRDKVEEINGLKGIEERKSIRNQLKCKSFEWFLDHVWRDNFFPSKKTFFGKLLHKDQNLCLERLPGTMLGLRLDKCAKGMSHMQSFVINTNTSLIMTDDHNCLDIGSDPKPGREGFFTACIGHDRQKWKYQSSSGKLVNIRSKFCLDYSSETKKINLETCETSKSKWLLSGDNWLV